MEVTDSLRGMILAGAPAGDLRRRAVEEGMVTLRQSGLRKIVCFHTNSASETRGSWPHSCCTETEGSTTTQELWPDLRIAQKSWPDL